MIRTEQHSGKVIERSGASGKVGEYAKTPNRKLYTTMPVKVGGIKNKGQKETKYRAKGIGGKAINQHY
tara:strand:- start:3044 stop:3247 length:204 start_codon:yes stop_codon:yes gene_type:complete